MSREVRAYTPVALRGLRVPATRRRWASVRGGRGAAAARARARWRAWRISVGSKWGSRQTFSHVARLESSMVRGEEVATEAAMVSVGRRGVSFTAE